MGMGGDLHDGCIKEEVRKADAQVGPVSLVYCTMLHKLCSGQY